MNSPRSLRSALALLLGLLPAQLSIASPIPGHPSEMMGVESCRDCHDSIVESWENSAHASSFADLHKRQLAEDIAGLLGIRPIEIRQHQSCVKCHFTEEEIHSTVQITEAVSCESCHGAAVPWIDIHNQSALGQQQRRAQSGAKGMVHSGNFHALGKRCYDCHVIDNEALVDIAGHPAMSEDFELYSWSQGEMKHNFLVSRPGKSTRKTSRTPQDIAVSRKRLLYLSGKLMHLSASLSALSKATHSPVDVQGRYLKLKNGNYTYAVQHAQRIQKSLSELRLLQETVPNDIFAQAIAHLESLSLVTGNQENIAQAAQIMEELAIRFSKEFSGTEFQALDPMLASLPMR